MRGKEESHDYRYFPDPDLPPLMINDDRIEKIKNQLPELPDEKKKRFKEQYKLKDYDAEILVEDQFVSSFFEELVEKRDSKIVVSWVTVELFSYLKKKDVQLQDSEIKSKKIGDLLDLIIDGSISNRQAKEIFEEYIETDLEASDFIKKKGIKQVSDKSEIEALIKSVLQKNLEMVNDYKKGKDKLFGFFVGQVMKESKGKANPQLVNQVLKELLSK
jgi:aspartyl-tRNA(Asn)/glutamyl-tRNA(Gln) amidotransferase subunit B